MDGRKAKLSQFIFTELVFRDAVDLSGEITNTLAFGFEAKSFAKQLKHLINLTHSTASVLAESEEHRGESERIPTL